MWGIKSNGQQTSATTELGSAKWLSNILLQGLIDESTRQNSANRLLNLRCLPSSRTLIGKTFSEMKLSVEHFKGNFSRISFEAVHQSDTTKQRKRQNASNTRIKCSLLPKNYELQRPLFQILLKIKIASGPYERCSHFMLLRFKIMSLFKLVVEACAFLFLQLSGGLPK